MQNSYDNQHSNSQVEYAGFWVRLAAWLIDNIIIFAALLIVRLIMSGIMAALNGTPLGGNILFQYNLKDIVLYVFKVLYFILFTYYTGTTIGKKAMNLRVVRADGEEKLGLFTVIYRETIGRFLGSVILEIGYLMIGIDKEKRGLHDILCDTRVIYAKKIKVFKTEQVFTPIAEPMGVNPSQPVHAGTEESAAHNYYGNASEYVSEEVQGEEFEEKSENIPQMPWDAPYTGNSRQMSGNESSQPQQSGSGYHMVKTQNEFAEEIERDS